MKAERSDSKVGDKFTFVCKQGLRTFDSQSVITSIDESNVKVTRDGVTIGFTRDGNPVKDERISWPGLRIISFPLEVGKKWSFSDTWSRFDIVLNRSDKGAVEVVSYGKVRVPAGEFDAFKSQMD